MLTLPEGRRSEPNSLFIVAQTTDSRTHVTVIRSAFGHELTAVSVVSIPCFLASIESTAIGGRVSPNILNSIQSGLTVDSRETEHNGVLVRANDLSSRVEH